MQREKVVNMERKCLARKVFSLILTFDIYKGCMYFDLAIASQLKMLHMSLKLGGIFQISYGLDRQLS